MITIKESKIPLKKLIYNTHTYIYWWQKVANMLNDKNEKLHKSRNAQPSHLFISNYKLHIYGQQFDELKAYLLTVNIFNGSGPVFIYLYIQTGSHTEQTVPRHLSHQKHAW